MTDEFESRPRIKTFRENAIKAIPCFPNDKATRTSLQSKNLTNLLITFIAWRLRHVRQTPRRILGRERLANDPRISNLTPNIDAFLNAVEVGDDLTPYLSLGAVKEGYTPSSEGANRHDSWADKDLLLNVMGLHHFHLGLTKEAKGHSVRTNEVLFASVTRDVFEIIGLFDHDAFERKDDGSMTPERTRLWSAYQSLKASQNLPGQLSIGGFGGLGVTMSSHPVAVVRAAQEHTRIIHQIEPQLDDLQYVRGLYPSSNVPSKPKLRWCYNNLDLGVCDEKAGFFGVISKGPN
ncbi:hypothetical protein K6M90_07365 [Rhizobium sp. 9T]|uniref:hypothetical protein n=1 Tax=Rhizobium croatiense TaxID=2867516 RepID=UPI001C935843|nr:hypothetical protein [Rhizobium croatiense]MBY4607470.1 hypothetical protein [Rhizobium croatiense]